MWGNSYFSVVKSTLNSSFHQIVYHSHPFPTSSPFSPLHSYLDPAWLTAFFHWFPTGLSMQVYADSWAVLKKEQRGFTPNLRLANNHKSNSLPSSWKSLIYYHLKNFLLDFLKHRPPGTLPYGWSLCFLRLPLWGDMVLGLREGLQSCIAWEEVPLLLPTAQPLPSRRAEAEAVRTLKGCTRNWPSITFPTPYSHRTSLDWNMHK